MILRSPARMSSPTVASGVVEHPPFAAATEAASKADTVRDKERGNLIRNIPQLAFIREWVGPIS
jgi:hypothetical protein